MAHVTEVVATQKLNNGQIAFCIRCCGNPSTDHWHTMPASVAADPDERKESLDVQHDFCAQQHAQMEKATVDTILEIGTDSMKKEHEI